MPDRNHKALGMARSFLAYVEANPDQRFWQALRNWTGEKAVYVLRKGSPMNVDTMLQRQNDDGGEEVELIDTFYWK